MFLSYLTKLSSFLQFDFKDVKFMQHKAQTLSLFNDGQVPCQFEFIQKPNEPTYCKPWLTANPYKGFIAQGEEHIQSRFYPGKADFIFTIKWYNVLPSGFIN